MEDRERASAECKSSSEAQESRSLRVDILSLFPGYFQGPLEESMLARARKKGILDIRLTNIRDFAEDRHNRCDDRPFGGGPGMVMLPGPVVNAVRSVKTDKAHVVYLSPQGKTLNAAKARELAQKSHLVLLCGHYEGIDERAIESVVDEEVSIGDYVLTNGCLPAIVLLDALSRFVPGVLGNEAAAEEDSFESGILDCPHYTRPVSFEGKEVPEVLIGGHHAKINAWRREKALEKTKKNRPDLLARKSENKIGEENE